MKRIVLVAVAVAAMLAVGVKPGAAYAPPAAVGSFSIPALGLYTFYYQQATQDHLMYGPAHYSNTGMPGCGTCTVAIAGHRVTHTHCNCNSRGGPFYDLNEKMRGMEIHVTVKAWHKMFIYRVTSVHVVSPNDGSLLDDVGHERLVLTTCTPRYTANYRLAVVAPLVRTVRMPTHESHGA